MPARIISILPALFCVLFGSGKIAANDLPQAIDPLFGLKYSVSAIRFEASPAELTQTCPELVNARWTRKVWIFARTEHNGTAFLVIGGFYIPRDSKEPAKPDTVGAILKLEEGKCELIGPARETFDSPPPEISTTTLSSLADDAVHRYAEAFGDKAKFEAALRRQGVRLNKSHSPILSEAISSLSRRP